MLKMKGMLVAGGLSLVIILSLSTALYISDLKLEKEVAAKTELKEDKKELNLKLENLNEVLETERKEAEKLNEAKTQFAKQIQEKEDEIQNLRADVSAGNSKLRITTKCPASTGMPEADTNASGIETGAAELDPTARLAYFNLRRGIVKVESLLELCRNELIIRTAEKKPP